MIDFEKNEKDIVFSHSLRRKHHDGMPRLGRGTKDNRKAQGHEQSNALAIRGNKGIQRCHIDMRPLNGHCIFPIPSIPHWRDERLS